MTGGPRRQDTLRRWDVAAGNFFFKHRNALFPGLFVMVALVGRPRVIGGPRLDRLLTTAGVLIALAGQGLRLLTIGYEYIERGGKEGKVYASRLVVGGVYALTRNPMYLGNMLIAVGMTMVSGAPSVYLIVLPFFLLVYQAIIAAEEAYLRGRFGSDYEAYCASVPRVIPSWRRIGSSLAGRPHDWRRAFRRDLSTMAGLLTGLLLLPVWRMLFLKGFAAAQAEAPPMLALEVVVLIAYGVLIYMKKRRWLFYLPE